ncbi:FKBP-type peptidyl-prolyl cis-trans isomerase [Galbitalea soli]|uniref:Peptidyl-prolyl cis-trans isomerase n=1 Tax=Galbitalea soli TaxID=1268042 RepID=A0A7C9TMZ9_9MICO|nr:peptidylprolyl isomerase [Galbitalea soli]NYJ30763.1 peptidylprolyl isomerase [Galbitalea soli]
MRKSLAVILAAAFAVSLAGCTAIPTATSCTPLSPAGDASNAVSVTGALGEKPTATIPTPLLSTKAETTTLVRGHGAPLTTGTIANVQASLYYGKTGQLLTATNFDAKAPLQVTVGVTSTSNVGKYLQCQRDGSRSVTVMTAKQFFGAAPDPSTGLTSTDTLILVTDIQKTFPGRATGALQLGQSGFPAVVTAPDGTPGVTISGSAPTQLRYEALRKGDGATVKKGDEILVHVTAIDWSTKSSFTSTWTSKVPQALRAESVTDSASGQLDPGSAKALIGQTVGSQVVVVVPPKFGYPSGKAPSGYPTNATVVYVYDILGIE